MDKILRQNIIDELTILLGRIPYEKEIINGQTDLHIMGKIRDKEIVKKNIQIADLAQQIVDVQTSILLTNDTLTK